MSRLGLFAMIAILSFAGGVNVRATDHYLNRSRGYSPFETAGKNGIRLIADSDTLDFANAFISDLKGGNHDFVFQTNSFSLAFKCADLHNVPHKKYPYISKDGGESRASLPGWSFRIGSAKESVIFTIRQVEKSDGVGSEAALRVTAEDMSGKILAESVVGKGLVANTGENTWRARLEKGTVSLEGGNRAYELLVEIPARGLEVESFGFRPLPGGEILLDDLRISYDDRISGSRKRMSETDVSYIIERSTDQTEGYWGMFDSSLDETLLKPGGDYRLAVIGSKEGYDIVYLSGAVVNRDSWNAGELKGRLMPTPFSDIFDLEWIDATGRTMSKGLKAQRDGDLLTLSFPYHSSVVRLRKIRNYK